MCEKVKEIPLTKLKTFLERSEVKDCSEIFGIVKKWFE